jgi:hypothetical protein
VPEKASRFVFLIGLRQARLLGYFARPGGE